MQEKKKSGLEKLESSGANGCTSLAARYTGQVSGEDMYLPFGPVYWLARAGLLYLTVWTSGRNVTFEHNVTFGV